MGYDLRDIKNVRIIAVAKRLGMKLGFRDDRVHGDCPFRFPDDKSHEPLSLGLDKESNTFRCLSCGNSGSVLDLVCQIAHIGPSEAIEWIGQNFCLPGVTTAAPKPAPAIQEEKPQEPQKVSVSPPTLSELYTDFLRLLGGASAEAIAYMHGRRISLDTLEKHGISDIKGYHGTANFLKEKYPAELLRQAGLFDASGKLWFEDYPLLFPYFRDGKAVFLQAHCMDSDRKPRYLRPREAVPFPYNVEALRGLADGDPVFLVEGIMDCLALEERGYHVVATPSMSSFKPEWVNDFRGLETYLVHTGEEVAERAANAIAVVFAKADLAVRSIKLPRGHDVNSFFTEGGTQPEFEHLVQTAPRVKTPRPILVPEGRGAMAEFLEELRQQERRTKATNRPFLGLDTGFPVLTRTCGGLDPVGAGQVCIVTGLPGIGKTTFCLQMAWQILENNEIAVLYVSYNEGRFGLRLKTLCQLSKMTANSVLRGEVQADRLASAVEAMSKWGKEFFVVEGQQASNVEAIRDFCQRVQSITGESRVMAVVDHLEGIPGTGKDLRGMAKIEACVAELHSLSRELHIPIVVVSSTAMANALGNGQKSGYGADTEYREDLLLVLEPDLEASRQRFPENDGRVVRVIVAKNRSGGVGCVAFDFMPDCHYFKERGKAPHTVELIGGVQPDQPAQPSDLLLAEAGFPSRTS